MSEHNSTDLESLVRQQTQSTLKAALVDTTGNITYSLIVGSILDYCSGLNIAGIITSRISATGMNAITGRPYGLWRDYVFEKTNTKEESTRLRKSAIDLIAFNTFQLPVYATAIAIGSYISEGKINLGKVKNGIEYLAIISPLIGPTLGWYMDVFRKICGITKT